MRIVISGGGTGGHIYPGLMIAERVQQSGGDALYIGTAKGLESKIVPKAGVPFETIEITGLRRSLSFENVRTLIRFWRGVQRAKKLLREFRPDVVVGTGGYVCAPVVYAAAKLNIPTMIHEQNAIPGLSNAFLSRFVDCVATSFKGSERYFRRAKSVVYTGNPRASAVCDADGSVAIQQLQLDSKQPVVLIFGGSRGALAVNQAVIDMMPLLIEQKDFQVIYVTGETYYQNILDTLKQRHPVLPDHLRIKPYLYDMPSMLAATSLMIGRAGASSLAELTALGIPSILIPSPNVTNNHQEKNAMTLVQAGAAEMIKESSLSGETLFASIGSILSSPQRMKSMSQQAKQLGEPKAIDRIFVELERLKRGR